MFVDDPTLLGSITGSEWNTPQRKAFVRGIGGIELGGHRYQGSLLDHHTTVHFGSGQALAVRPYGLATLLSIEHPTVARVSDDDDFSAYLRDADRAWIQGVFSDVVTSPLSVVADLASLGWPATPVGPDLRTFVFPGGEVSTSPYGARLGRLEDGVASVTSRWARINAASKSPCAVGLSAVLVERDRVEALAERPWMSRYLVAAEMIRASRLDGRRPTSVAGFGAFRAYDPTHSGNWAPVLLGLEDGFELRDPTTGCVLSLAADEAGSAVPTPHMPASNRLCPPIPGADNSSRRRR